MRKVPVRVGAAVFRVGGSRMNRFTAALCALASVVSLAACASQAPMNRMVPLAARDKIAATDVVTPITQNEITIAIPVAQGVSSQTGAQFGLVGALVGSLIETGIDAANAAAAETSVKPLRDALVDYNFDETLQANLKTGLAQASWLNSGGYRVIRETTTANLEQTLKNSQANSVLMVSASYQLNFNADELTIEITPRLLPKTADLQAMLPEKFDPKASQITTANELYRNTFTYKTAIVDATNDRDDNIKLWSASNGAPMRAALADGVAKLTQMFVADLAMDPANAFDARTTKLEKFNAELVAGHVLVRDDLGTQVALTSGAQVYVTNVSLAPLKIAGPKNKLASPEKRKPKSFY